MKMTEPNILDYMNEKDPKVRLINKVGTIDCVEDSIKDVYSLLSKLGYTPQNFMNPEDIDITLTECLDESLSKINGRREDILRKRTGLNKEGRIYTLKEIAGEQGVTGPAIRVHEAYALRRMKHPRIAREFCNSYRNGLLTKVAEKNPELIVGLFNRNNLLEENNNSLEGEVSRIKNSVFDFAMGNKPLYVEEPQKEDVLGKSIDELEVSVRSYNCLKHSANIKTIGELMGKSERELLRSKNFGRKALNDIKRAIGELGLTLRER